MRFWRTPYASHGTSQVWPARSCSALVNSGEWNSISLRGLPGLGQRSSLMIILDTSVLSELMRPQPSPLVRDWIGQQVSDELCTTAVTVAEIRYGLERLPDGRRKASLVAAATEVFTAFGEYIYPSTLMPPSLTRRSWRVVNHWQETV